MESSSAKRRKLDHSATIDHVSYESAASSGLYRPSSFILETEELLKEVRVDYDTALAGANELLHRLKNSIEAIEPHGPTPIHEAVSKLEKPKRVKVPFPDPRPPADSPYKVSFAKPSQCNVVGSFVSRTMAKTCGDYSVDMVVVMPQDLFQDKDYLNLRYFYKRAYYLAVIAASLKEEFNQLVEARFGYLNGNTLLPVLELQPRKDVPADDKKTKRNGRSDSKTLEDYRIRIIPCRPEGLFSDNKLVPSAASIRSGATEEKAATATPFYNSTVKADGSPLSYLKLLRQADKICPAFKDACILGRIWLHQRGLGGAISHGGFGNFEWSVIMALLLQSGGRKGQAVLSASLSSTQLFKAMIQFLSITDFTKKPCVLGPAIKDAESIRESGPVVYDATRQLNICFKMSVWSADLLHQQAKITHSLLGDTVTDQFGNTFIAKVDTPLQNFDLIVKISCPENLHAVHTPGGRGATWNFANNVHSVLTRALGDRTRLVHVQSPGGNSWSLATEPQTIEVADLTVGILFDPVNVSRNVDRGPSSEDKTEARKFRQFWGEKSELRQFEDGSIVEALIWSSKDPFQLCEEIIRYILARQLSKLGYDAGADIKLLKGFTSLIGFKPTDAAVFNAALEGFKTFERDVRDLEDIPLYVRELAPTAPGLRHASIKTPFLGGAANAAPQPLDVVISFEASSKWPDNLTAIQRAKIAFLLKIGSLLEEAKPSGVKTLLGLEEVQSEIENLAFLDVLYESGAAFRLRIQSDLEESILERRTKDKTLDQHIRTESATLLAKCRRDYTNLPLQSQTITTYATRHPALSPTIRLLKHWFNAHKLSLHFTDEFVELVALHVFLTPYPWDPPSSANTGLLRALAFLAKWDWRAEPLLVNTSGEVTAADRAAAETRLEAWRKLDPNLNHTVLFAATAFDASGTAFTAVDGHPQPTKVVAARMTALARSAAALVRERGVELDPRALFAPSLREYDVLIHLSRRAVKLLLQVAHPDEASSDADGDEAGASDDEGGGAARHRLSRFKNLNARAAARALLPVATHPVRALLAQLAAAYAGPLVFFHGAPDDVVIGAVWNPQVQRRSFRVNLPCSYKPVGGAKRAAGDEDEEMDDDDDEVDDEQDTVEVNREGILAEIARIGGDLVERIEVKGE